LPELFAKGLAPARRRADTVRGRLLLRKFGSQMTVGGKI